MVMIGCYLGKACLLVLDVTFSFMLHQFYQSHLYLSILSSVPKNFTLYPKLDLKLFIYSHARRLTTTGLDKVQQQYTIVTDTESKQYNSSILEDTFLYNKLDRLSRHIDSPASLYSMQTIIVYFTLHFTTVDFLHLDFER